VASLNDPLFGKPLVAKHDFNLEQAYMNFDLRDSFLKRQA